MEELKINKHEAEDIENVLRLVHNIYRADVTTGETNFDRQLQRATKYIRDVLAISKEPHPVENCGCSICHNWRADKYAAETNCQHDWKYIGHQFNGHKECTKCKKMGAYE